MPKINQKDFGIVVDFGIVLEEERKTELSVSLWKSTEEPCYKDGQWRQLYGALKDT